MSRSEEFDKGQNEEFKRLVGSLQHDPHPDLVTLDITHQKMHNAAKDWVWGHNKIEATTNWKPMYGEYNKPISEDKEQAISYLVSGSTGFQEAHAALGGKMIDSEGNCNYCGERFFPEGWEVS